MTLIKLRLFCFYRDLFYLIAIGLLGVNLSIVKQKDMWKVNFNVELLNYEKSWLFW